MYFDSRLGNSAIRLVLARFHLTSRIDTNVQIFAFRHPSDFRAPRIVTRPAVILGR